MEGADLGGAEMQGAVKSSDLSKSNVPQDQVNTMLGDGFVTLPEGIDRPAHWPEENLATGPFSESDPFYDAWRAWMDEEGFDWRRFDRDENAR